MQKWNKPAAGGQRVNEKNVFIFLVIMFTRAIKMPKNDLLFVFFADDS